MSKMSDHTTPFTFTGWTCPTSWHVEVHVMHWLGMSDVHTHSPHQSIVHVAPCIGVKLQPWYTILHAHTVTYNHAASCTYSVFHHCGWLWQCMRAISHTSQKVTTDHPQCVCHITRALAHVNMTYRPIRTCDNRSFLSDVGQCRKRMHQITELCQNIEHSVA